MAQPKDENPGAGAPEIALERSSFPLRHMGTIALVVVLGVAMALISFFLVRHYEDKWQREDFSIAARGPAQELRRRAEASVEVLLSLGQLYAASEEVAPEDFRAFTEGPLERHKEICALEWVPRVEGAARDSFEQSHRLSIVETKADGTASPAGAAAQFFPVLYAEPLDANRLVLGGDHWRDALRQRAMEEARNTGRPVVTPRQSSNRESNAPPVLGCHVFLAVYRIPGLAKSSADRAVHLAGFVVAVINLEELIQGALQPRGMREIDVQLVDATAPDEYQLLHAKESRPRRGRARLWHRSAEEPLQDITRFDLAGHEWTVVCRPTEAFARRFDWESWAVLGGGALLTTLMAGYLFSILGRTAKIERTVALRTRELGEANSKLQAEVIERVRTEKAISQSEARLQAILDNSTAVIYVKDTEGRYVLINREFEHLFHVSRQEAKGKTDYDLFDNLVAQALRANDQKALAAHTAVQFEEVAPVDGQNHTYVSIKFPMFDADGAAYGICGISTDITERVQTVQALQDSEALYHSLVESLPLNVVRKNLEGKVTFGNERVCQTLGRPLEGLLGKTDFDLFPKNLAEKYVADDRNVIETGQVFEDIEEHHSPDGNDRYMHVLKSPVIDATGRIVGLQVIFWDVTPRKRAEKELHKTAAELTRSNRELELFAYVASHDLQEPLRMIASYTQLLARRYKGKLDAEAEEFIGYAVDGALRMQQLINDLLAYSRVGTKGKPFAPTDVEKVFETAMTNLKIAREESGAVITHGPLPTVNGDYVQLVQLFQNLLSNAIKFRKEAPPRIQIKCERRPTEWLFEFRDNGIGIDPQYFDRIFIIFQRLHNQQEYAGTGIGLALCKRIVERHGGRIWVESQPGQGASFFFTLPVMAEAVEVSA